MGKLNDIDNIENSKYGRYLMDLSVRNRKWTHLFGDKIFDTGQVQSYSLYENIKKYNNVKFRRSHYQFIFMEFEGMINIKY